MTNRAPDAPHSPARRVARALALAPAVAGVLLAAPAWASAPDSWQAQPKVNLLHAILLLGGSAAGLIIVISLLVLLPGMVRHDGYQPGLSWRNGPEWFGGPRGGLEGLDGEHQQAVTSHTSSRTATSAAAVEATAEGERADRGGASARW
ncbi:MAG: hypothetical protein ACRDPB_09820 [Nocardioidaceae bacterium]